MSDFKALNGRIHNRNKGVVFCEECGRILGDVGDNLKSFSLSFVCKCGTLCNMDYDKKKVDETKTKAIIKNNRVVCPCCGETLLNLFSENVRNMTVKAVCDCGAVLSGIKEYEDVKTRIKEYTEYYTY